MPPPPDFSQRLRSEIGKWIQDGLVTEEAARAILLRYPSTTQQPPSSSALARSLGIIGALLIGLGVILVFAYNWNTFSKTAKLSVAFLPLLINLILAAYTISRKNDSNAWRESVGISLCVSVAACIALVGQTLQLQSDLAQFYFVWQLTCLPFLFALRSKSVFGLLCLVTICWAVSTQFADRHLLPVRFLATTLPLLAYFIWERRSSRSTFTAIVFSVSTTWIFARVSWEAFPSWPAITGFALISATFYIWFARERLTNPIPKLFTPAELICKLGLTVTAFVLSFADSWSDSYYRQPIDTPLTYLIFAAVSIAYLFELSRQLRFATWHDFPWALLPAVIALLSFTSHSTAAIILTPYIAVMAIAAIHHGYTTNSIARLNHGLFIALALAALRFFDEEFSMLAKGSAFIVVGIFFLATNLHFIKRRKVALHESN